MPVPPTPFLPRGVAPDQSLLLATEPIFDADESLWGDETFAGPSSRPAAGLLDDQPDSTYRLEEEVLHGRGERQQSVASTSLFLVRRSSITSQWGIRQREGDLPIEPPDGKNVKPPTPKKDDFYSRRVADCDRRSSAGVASPVLPTLTLPPSGPSESALRKSTSSKSTAVNTVQKPVEVQLGPSDVHHRMDLAVGEHRADYSGTSALARYLARRQGEPDQRPESPPSLPSSLGLGSESASRSSDRSTANMSNGTLNRVRSAESSSRRSSIGERVIGFVSSLLTGSQPAPSSSQAPEAGPSAIPSDSEDRLNTATSPPKSLRRNIPVQPAPFLPGFRVPHIAPLTRPVAVQPRQTASSQAKTVSAQRPPSSTVSRKPLGATSLNHKRSTQTAFTSAALARLPAPGKGASSSVKPSTVSDAERARNLAAKKAMYDALASAHAPPARKPSTLPPESRKAVTKTVPVTGRTPGKASRARAEERLRYEEGLKARQKQREDELAKMEQLRDEIEEEEQRIRRKETVIRARPVPEMYRQAGNGMRL